MKGHYTRLTTVLLLTAVFTTIAVLSSLADGGDPLLVLPEKSFDFGYVKQHVSISHPFVIINGGGDSLYILQLKPG